MLVFSQVTVGLLTVCVGLFGGVVRLSVAWARDSWFSRLICFPPHLSIRLLCLRFVFFSAFLCLAVIYLESIIIIVHLLFPQHIFFITCIWRLIFAIRRDFFLFQANSSHTNRVTLLLHLVPRSWTETHEATGVDNQQGEWTFFIQPNKFSNFVLGVGIVEIGSLDQVWKIKVHRDTVDSFYSIIFIYLNFVIPCHNGLSFCIATPLWTRSGTRRSNSP